MTGPIVIVGGGLAGAKAAETLRDAGFDGPIVLIGEETERPYERPPLSKGYLLGADPREQAFVHDEDFYAAHDIELRLGVRVTMLDPAAHTVTLDGVSTLRYDKLLLATGARVRTLRVPGADLTGVHYLRTLPEADELRQGIRAGARVVVIGAGWIGLETAAAARQLGAEVTVIEVDALPLRRVLGDEVARIYAELHRDHGVDLRFSSGVRRIKGDGAVEAVVLEDDIEVPADLVVVGIGVTPATELADVAGLTVDNGVVTDAQLRTSDPDIYACGDVANSFNTLLGRRIRVEHWGNALSGGPLAARAILGQEVVYDQPPYFYSDQYDLGMEYAGYVEPGGYDQVVFRGDPATRQFLAFWVRDGRVLAGMNANIWEVNDAIQELVRAGYRGRSVDLAKLADPDVPLTELLT